MTPMTDETPRPAATPVPPVPDAPVPAPPAPAPPLTPVQVALAGAVREIERHVATAGWDGPVRVFALVRTAAALDASPELADQLPPDVVAAAQSDPTHLTSVEQEGLPPATDLEELLGGLLWPGTVDGAAVVVERVMLPPAAEEEMPADDDAALAYLMAHPDRQDVRIAVGALRTGESWTALRTRAHDADADVAVGPDLVPGLLEALRATFS